MFDYERIHDEVETYLAGWYQYYDVPEIMADLREYTADDGGSIKSLDDVDPDDWTDILQRHDKTA